MFEAKRIQWLKKYFNSKFLHFGYIWQKNGKNVENIAYFDCCIQQFAKTYTTFEGM
jgi:hypothetical protein